MVCFQATASYIHLSPVPTRRTCKCVLSTCKNVGKIWGSVRGEYRLSTDLGARRHNVALLVHEELSLRSGLRSCYGSPPVRVTRVPSTANALSLIQFSHGHLLYGRRT